MSKKGVVGLVLALSAATSAAQAKRGRGRPRKQKKFYGLLSTLAADEHWDLVDGKLEVVQIVDGKVRRQGRRGRPPFSKDMIDWLRATVRSRQQTELEKGKRLSFRAALEELIYEWYSERYRGHPDASQLRYREELRKKGKTPIADAAEKQNREDAKQRAVALSKLLRRRDGE